MTENLNITLQNLKQEIVERGGVPVVLERNALDTKFHGLNLRQLVMLTDAPTLAVFAERRASDGARIEEFSVDGKDRRQCDSVAQQLILGDSSLEAGDIREVYTLAEGAPGPVLVRDHNDVVYRVTEREATIDQGLTTTLQHRRQSLLGEPRLRSGLSQQPVLVTNGFTFYGIAGEILHGLSAARLRNAVAVEETEKLIKASGERDLDSALAAAEPEMLAAAFRQIISASQQIEVLLDGLVQRTRTMMRLMSQGNTEAVPSPNSSREDGFANAAGIGLRESENAPLSGVPGE